LGPRTVPIFFENSMGLEAYPCLPSGVDPACHGKYGYSRVARATATPNGLPSRWQKTASVSCLRTVERWTRPDRSPRNYVHSVCCFSAPTCFFILRSSLFFQLRGGPWHTWFVFRELTFTSYSARMQRVDVEGFFGSSCALAR
jgi:hypothetical protein